jgi:hypothetical protein
LTRQQVQTLLLLLPSWHVLHCSGKGTVIKVDTQQRMQKQH